MLSKRTRLFQVGATFVLGLTIGTGVVLANHPWLCSGSTAFHWGSRTISFLSAREESTTSGTVVRNRANYTSAFNGSVTLWNGTLLNLTQSTSGRLRLFYDAYGNTGWLGLASLNSVSGCTVTLATSRLNDTFFRDTTRFGQTAVNHVSCQEVGHTFGLQHDRTRTNTCMNDRILTAGNAISQHDRDQLSTIYANIP